MLLFLFACPVADEAENAQTDRGELTDTGDSTANSDSGTPGDSGDTGIGLNTRVGCEPRHDTFISALQSDLDASDALGVSAAVMESGELTCRVALGRKWVEGDEAPDVDTLFQIGSTTKMFTAVALLQRVELGGLNLGDSLAQAYPDSEFALDDTWNDDVLLYHLLSHQGGFYDYFDWTSSEADSDLVDWHADVFFPYLWLMNEPGHFWNYSNPNFNLAGLIVQAADGTRMFPDIMVQDVFAPLGMVRTYQRKAEVEADGNFAEGFGYIMRSNGEADYTDVPIKNVPDLAAARPAGAGTWTTPSQMMEMARFLMYGDTAVLSDDARLSITVGHVPLLSTADDAKYGYGVIVYPGISLADGYHAVRTWDHGGNTLSYSSAFTLLPDYDFAVSVLSSGYGTDFSLSIATAVSTLVADLPPVVGEPEFSWEPDRLDLHVGTYDDAYNVGEMIITREGDTLLIEMPFLEELGYVVAPELVPISSDIWYLDLDGDAYDLTFIGEGQGPSRWVRNRLFVGTRVEE